MALDKIGLTNSNGLLKITPKILSELGGKTQRSSQKLYFPLFYAYFWLHFKIRLLSSDFYLTKKSHSTHIFLSPAGMVNMLP